MKLGVAQDIYALLQIDACIDFMYKCMNKEAIINSREASFVMNNSLLVNESKTFR